MRERDDELLPAVLISIGVHLGVVVLLLLVAWLTPDSEPISAAGAPIDAVFVDIGSIELPDPSEAVPMPQPAPQPEPEAAETPSTPPPQPLPEPSPQDAVVEQQVTPQERVPTPDQVEQERVSRLAIERAEAEAREQEARRIQEQIDLTERQRQQEAEEQQRLARQQAARERLEQLRRERERARQEADLAARETPPAPTPLPTAPAVPPAARAGQPAATPGTNGTDTGLQARYGAAIVAAVERQWVIPDSVQPNQPCRVRIRQIVGGEVISATADASCPYDEAGRRSIEAAVLRASPLPYAGFESVFRSDINFTFRAPE